MWKYVDEGGRQVVEAPLGYLLPRVPCVFRIFRPATGMIISTLLFLLRLIDEILFTELLEYSFMGRIKM